MRVHDRRGDGNERNTARRGTARPPASGQTPYAAASTQQRNAATPPSLRLDVQRRLNLAWPFTSTNLPQKLAQLDSVYSQHDEHLLDGHSREAIVARMPQRPRENERKAEAPSMHGIRAPSLYLPAVRTRRESAAQWKAIQAGLVSGTRKRKRTGHVLVPGGFLTYMDVVTTLAPTSKFEYDDVARV